MELAINSLVLFVLFVFPVIVFRHFYFKGFFSQQSGSKNWLTTFYMSLFPGIIIQIISFYTFTHSIYREPLPDIYTYFNCIYKDYNAKELPIDLFKVDLYYWGAIYVFLTLIISSVIAQLSWKLVRYLELDIRFSSFRFDNYLYYYFKGECLKFKEFSGLTNNLEVAFTEVDVLVDIGSSEPRLYKGLYRQHTINKETNELKALYITDVRRFSNSRPRVLKVVPGHIMIIPAEKILNINLNYLTTPHEKYNKKFLFLANLIIIILVIYNKLWLKHNPDFTKDILERFFLLLMWIPIATFIHTFIKPPIAKVTLIRSILGTIIVFEIISAYYFFIN